MTTWIKDDNGNRCSVEYWGSEEKARKALATQKNCSDCSNCSYCSNCSCCSNCSYCSYCSNCADCSCCSNCSYCSNCSDCSDCANCSYCSYCSDCSCCSNCSNCSNCSDCSDCSHCSHSLPTEVGEVAAAVPEIPSIPDIHKHIYERVSQPNALNMCDWHSCETTHCRAGWTVHEAGEAGYALERFHNTELAAMLIYRASGYEINPARFYDTAEDAMADMKRLAEAS